MPKQYYFLGICLSLLVLFSPALAQTTSFSLSFTPTVGTIAQGGTTSASINITGSTDVTGDGVSDVPVVFAVSQGLPAGLSVSFYPDSCPPPCNSIMVVQASPAAPAGTYAIPVFGAALGQTATATFTVTISALPKFDYSVSLTSSQGSAATRENVDTTLNLEQLSGTSDNVTLSASGQPSGVTVNFNPVSCAPPCSALVSFNISSVTSGIYPITLSATAGSLTKRVTYNLQVAPSSLSNFSFSMLPQSSIIKRGESVNALVNLTQLSGTSQSVALTVANQPASTTVQIYPTACEPPCNAVLSVATGLDIIPGTYKIYILGYSGGITKTVDYNLVVADSPTYDAFGNVTSGGGISTGDTIAPGGLPNLGTTFSSYIFTRSLYRGLSGDDVLRLQKYLAADPNLYPEGISSGYFGALTEQAVGRFQIRYGIVSSPSELGWGRVGPRTRAKLNALLST